MEYGQPGRGLHACRLSERPPLRLCARCRAAVAWIPARVQRRSSGRARYLAAVPPAIAGQHGDVHTFRVCCRLVRGFALDDDEALAVLGGWNARLRAAVVRPGAAATSCDARGGTGGSQSAACFAA